MSSNTNIWFSASHDLSSKIVTGAALVVLLLIAVRTHSLIGISLFALFLLAAYAWSPSGYAISGGFVVVRRLIGNVRIAADGIRDIRVGAEDDFRGAVRVFGSGGLFGHYGIFHTPRLGKSTWYVTNRKYSVVLTGVSGTVVVSPNDVDGFIAAARASAALPASPRGVGKPSATRRTGWIGAVLGIAAAVFAVVSLLYAPGVPAYTLTSDTLTIHDRFYPVTVNAASVDVGNARVIDLDRDKGWEPVVRTNGFGNVHYHAGWFRVSSGKVVRLYRADGTRLVLLPPKGAGTPVLLETREPGKFLAELQREWAHGS